MSKRTFSCIASRFLKEKDGFVAPFDAFSVAITEIISH